MSGLTEAEISFLSGVDSPTVANALEGLRLRDRSEGYLGGDVSCRFPELGTMVGRALTVTVRNTEGVTGGGAGYWDLWDRLDGLDGPVVLVMASDARRQDRVAVAGELMCTLAQKLGAVGLVTDGAVRDISEARQLGFHYFARHVAVSHAWFELCHVGEPVDIGGQQVRTGDIVHGDRNGVVLVPDESLDELPDAVGKVQTHEKRFKAQLSAADFSYSDFKSRIQY